MTLEVRSVAMPALVFILLAVRVPAPTQAQEIWVIRGGTTTFSFDAEVMESLGLEVGEANAELSSAAEGRWSWVLPIDPESPLVFSIADDTVRLLEVRLLHYGDLTVIGPQGQGVLHNPVIEPLDGESFDRFMVGDDTVGRAGGLVLERIKAGFDRSSHTIRMHSGTLLLSAAWARALGHPELASHRLGTATLDAPAEWVGGMPPHLETEAPSAARAPSPGPDMTFCQLYSLGQYGRLGSTVGLSVATTSWNVGDADMMWFPMPNENHPFIVMNLYRIRDDRFEQIGQSWIKHGFYALGNTQCGGTCSYEPGHGQGNWLGTGCTDTYSSSLNAGQNGLGPRYELNPWTGEWTYAGSHNSQGNHGHDAIQHRLQVHDDDLDPAQNPGASYYVEGFYVCLDDVDQMNNASWKPVTVSGSPGGTWSFSMSAAGTPPELGFAIKAWGAARQTILAQEVPPIEFVSPDGRCILATKTTDLGGGWWHYEYALLNVDMDRKGGSFSIPVTPGTVVTNIGFHAVEHHDEEAAGYSNDPWTATVAGRAITWTTPDNPLRWGTLYNFRFDANVPPDPGSVTVTLGLFDPGTPESVTGDTVGPEQGPPDCNGNSIPDECDVDCANPGCDVPGCGQSADCNGNALPDECEPDCNGNAVPDDCDITGGTSQDCDGNGVPDECDPDSDGDGVPDGCDVCPGFDDGLDADGDAVPDGCDLCPGFDDGLDADGDAVPDGCDNCPNDFNPGQEDQDGDSVGDLCDPDFCEVTVEDEHFDTDPGWTVENPTATDGQWEWGLPVGGGDRWDPPDDYDGGGACYLTDNVDGNSDVDGGTTIVLSPIYTLSAGHAELSYAYWIGTNGSDDSLVVEVSNDGGLTWSQVASYTTDNQQWWTETVLLDSVLPMTDQVQLRFLATDGGTASVLEAAIDAVTITANCLTDCNGNGIPDDQDIAGGTSGDCNGNDVPDECDIASGTSEDDNGNGIPDECEPAGDALFGGLLWDEWWLVNGAVEPQGDHPLYPPQGQQSGSTTYRCEECHGWDYKGADGAYGSGPHYTGIAGVYGSTMTPQEMFDLIKLDSVPNGHDFATYGLSDQDVWDLVQFVQDLVIDTDNYVDSAGQFLGDAVQGQTNYTGGSPSCQACHGADGTAINFGTPEAPEWVGTVAVQNPWRMLHKTRFGQPGTPMQSWLADGGDDQGAADIGLYAQLNFPVECLDSGPCDDGDPCNGAEACVGGYCEPGPVECGAGCVDCNANGTPDQCESFVVLGDMNSDCLVDLDDFATFALCFSGAEVTTPPGGCTPTEFGTADLDGDGDVDLSDFSTFANNFTG